MNKSLLKNEKRIIFLGDNKVGKTTILTQFTKNKFLTNYIPTIGVDNCVATMGTAFTTTHANLLKKITDNII